MNAGHSPSSPTAGLEATQPWIRELVIHPPAAKATTVRSSGGGAVGASSSDPALDPVLPQRKRPYIYVYDLPPAYNSRMLQYRVEK